MSDRAKSEPDPLPLPPGVSRWPFFVTMRLEVDWWVQAEPWGPELWFIFTFGSGRLIPFQPAVSEVLNRLLLFFN